MESRKFISLKWMLTCRLNLVFGSLNEWAQINNAPFFLFKMKCLKKFIEYNRPLRHAHESPVVECIFTPILYEIHTPKCYERTNIRTNIRTYSIFYEQFCKRTNEKKCFFWTSSSFPLIFFIDTFLADKQTNWRTFTSKPEFFSFELPE